MTRSEKRKTRGEHAKSQLVQRKQSTFKSNELRKEEGQATRIKPNIGSGLQKTHDETSCCVEDRGISDVEQSVNNGLAGHTSEPTVQASLISTTLPEQPCKQVMEGSQLFEWMSENDVDKASTSSSILRKEVCDEI